MLGAEGHALDRDGLLGHVDLVLVEGNGGLGGVRTDVVLDLLGGNRGALDANLLAGDRNLYGLGLLNLVLAQASLAGSDAFGANAELLLLEEDVVGLASNRLANLALVAVDDILLGGASSGTRTCTGSACTSCTGEASEVGIVSGATLGVSNSRAVGDVGLDILDIGEAVVLVDRVLISSGELILEVDVRSILNKILVEGELQLVTVETVATERNQAGAHAEQTVADLNEGGLTGLVINEMVVDLAELLALSVESGGVQEILDIPLVRHVLLILS